MNAARRAGVKIKDKRVSRDAHLAQLVPLFRHVILRLPVPRRGPYVSALGTLGRFSSWTRRIYFLWHYGIHPLSLVSVLGFEEYTNGNKRQNKQTQSVILREIFVPFTVSDR
jgi:hypothetical protein